jgi:hypothetical protein
MRCTAVLLTVSYIPLWTVYQQPVSDRFILNITHKIRGGSCVIRTRQHTIPRADDVNKVVRYGRY